MSDFDFAPCSMFDIVEHLPGRRSHSQRLRITLPVPFRDLAGCKDCQVAVDRDTLLEWCAITARKLEEVARED